VPLVEYNNDAVVDYAIWSPTGAKIAYVLNHDVYIRDLSGSTERVTYDGGAEIFNGVADWVYEGSPLSTAHSRGSILCTWSDMVVSII
jgi:hypothetical protein